MFFLSVSTSSWHPACASSISCISTGLGATTNERPSARYNVTSSGNPSSSALVSLVLCRSPSLTRSCCLSCSIAERSRRVRPGQRFVRSSVACRRRIPSDAPVPSCWRPPRIRTATLRTPSACLRPRFPSSRAFPRRREVDGPPSRPSSIDALRLGLLRPRTARGTRATSTHRTSASERGDEVRVQARATDASSDVQSHVDVATSQGDEPGFNPNL